MADHKLGFKTSQERDRRSAYVTGDLADAGSSDSVDIRGFANISVAFPASMSSTNVDVEVSADDSSWFDLYARDGTKISFTSSSSRCFDVPELAGVSFVRFGTDADDSTRDFTLMGKV